MSYDEYEAMMREAGWSLDEIETMWLKHEAPEASGDSWPTEDWDKD